VNRLINKVAVKSLTTLRSSVSTKIEMHSQKDIAVINIKADKHAYILFLVLHDVQLELTSWSRVLPGKLMVPYIAIQFLPSYGTSTLIIVLTSVRDWTLS
jgi:hypothetical protein